MVGPVRESPAAVARSEGHIVPDLEKGLDMTPGKIITSEEAARINKPLGLVEKFALQMGGVQPEKMLRTLKATAFRLPDKKQGTSWTPQEVTNEQMMALLVVANKYGLNPFIKEIYAFPDKGGIVPIVGVDGWSRMINDHEQFDGMKFVNSETDAVSDEHAKRCPEAITCIIYRKDRTHPTEVTEYLDEVYRPPFVRNNETKLGPWQSHTKRMLRHKAMIQCARIAFGFTGIHDDDEAERIVASDYVTPSDKPTQAQSLSDRFKTAEDAPPAIDHESEAKGDSADVIDGELDHSKDEKSTEDAPVCDHVWLLDKFTKLGDTVRCRNCPETKIYEPEKRVVKDSPKPPKDATKKKAAVKKVAPKAKVDPTAKFMERIIAAKNKDDVTKILTEVADAKGLSAAKRGVLKKTAEVKVKEFTDDAK